MEVAKLYFDVLYQDELTGRIELDGINLVKKECYLPEDEKNKFIFFPFYNLDTGYDIHNYLKDRVVPENRYNLEAILNALDIEEYNVYDILKKTHGATFDDYIWFRFDDLPADGQLKYQDVRLR